MSVIASRGQLRLAYLRWALVLAPGILLLGTVSGFFSGSGAGDPWFDALAKPAINPPPLLFPIVWTVLYLMMGLALAMVVSAWGARGRGAAIGAFVVQLALNLAWSPTFFGAHRIAAALAICGALDIAVIACVALFWRVRPLAGALLLPYLAWGLFATVLTAEFLKLNPAS